MARIILLALLLLAASLLPPAASQAAATKCEYARHAGHGHSKHPVGVRKIVVDAGGAGDFASIQKAIDSVPEGNTMRVIVRINAGTYIEKVVVPASKPYITFQGAGSDATVVEWHDRASDPGPDGQPLRTYNTASVTILASYFTAKNISFKVSRQTLFANQNQYSVVHPRVDRNGGSEWRSSYARAHETHSGLHWLVLHPLHRHGCRGGRQSDNTSGSQRYLPSRSVHVSDL